MHQSLFVSVSVAERMPRRITRFLYKTIILSLLKDTRHPALHRTPMERRAPTGRLGKMCPRRPSGDTEGRSKSQVCMDATVSPFGMVTTRGLVTMRFCVYGVDSLQ